MNTDVQAKLFPEVGAGGFSRLDGTIEFYTRVHALLQPQMAALDFGAGRGGGLIDDPVPYRRKLRCLRGRVARVIGLDVDPAVLDNPGLDEAHVIEPGRSLPLEDHSVDLVLADFVFEHIRDPNHCASELERIVRPEGWICARTPNRWNYVAVAARLIPEKLRAPALRRVQPERKREDVFPTFYRMNDLGTLRRLFPPERWRDYSYVISPEPAYVPRRAWAWRMAMLFDNLLPAALQSNILAFFQKVRRPS